MYTELLIEMNIANAIPVFFYCDGGMIALYRLLVGITFTQVYELRFSDARPEYEFTEISEMQHRKRKPHQ